MKILIVSTNQSHPTDAGNRAAIMGQALILKHLGCDVHFLFADMSLRKTDESEMISYWEDNYHVYRLPKIFKLRRFVIDKIRLRLFKGHWKCDDHYPFGIEKYVKDLHSRYRYDAIIVQYMRLSKLLSNTDIPKKAIYTHDVFSYKDARVGEPFYESCDAHQEAIALQRCPNIFAIQENEASFFSYLAPQSKIYTVYSHFEFHKQPIVSEFNILYLASRMEFNVNGINWFLDHVWTKLLELIPEANLIIGGSVCEMLLPNKYPHVKMIGFVKNLEDFYKMGNIVINPVYQGTGLKIKTFEAISYGKITITHPHSTNGIFRHNEAPLLVARQTQDWINYIIQIKQGIISTSEFQSKDELYIQDMTNHIYSQYKMFLS